jgi:hypothetical protein
MRSAKIVILVVCVSLLFGMVAFAQDEKVKENWKDLQKLWTNLRSGEIEDDEDVEPGPIPGLGGGGPRIIPDGKLKLYARIATLFEKAGFFEEDLSGEAKALKRIFKIMVNPPTGQQLPIPIVIPGGGGPQDRFQKGYERFEEGLESEDKNDIKKGLKRMKVLKGLSKEEKNRIVEVVMALEAGKEYPE